MGDWKEWEEILHHPREGARVLTICQTCYFSPSLVTLCVFSRNAPDIPKDALIADERGSKIMSCDTLPDADSNVLEAVSFAVE